jgi:hypothetical protein
MMADEKKSKTSPAAKKEAVPKTETPAATEPAKTESNETPGTAPASYSRGEGQKPVTQAYKDNWNAIFGKKKKR